jgi:hypothetical protein
MPTTARRSRSDKAFQWIAPELVKTVAPRAAISLPEGWERLAGRYRSPWGDAQVLAIGSRLALIDPSLPDPLLLVTWLHPVGGTTFRSDTTNGFGSNGEPVVFEVDDGGRVRRLKVGDNFLTPVSEW